MEEEMEEEMYQAYQKLQEHEQECKYTRDMEIQRLHQELDNSIPILLIKKKIEELEKEENLINAEYFIKVLQKLLDERNRDGRRNRL